MNENPEVALINSIDISSQLWESGHEMADSGSYARITMSHRTLHSRFSASGAHGPHLTLWTAATRKIYTICRADGHVIARDLFSTPLSTAAAASEAAARQAIWVGGYVYNEWGAHSATLHLILETQRGIDLAGLERHAFTVGLDLEVRTAPRRNPAISQCRVHQYVDWRRSEFGALIQTAPPDIAESMSALE
ncbi:hypothetical protein HLB23_25850 [Nocardia uniformis]|uniref:Uncharacterized protein n=1 Tax=Nocardia uniformis TaxID=53432 RepID=A0A849CA50_9NOCA|nr:hypothetical protein [Nocardia uniformis]NNH73240.1 hypothetical protein [Nocardia uniformis]